MKNVFYNINWLWIVPQINGELGYSCLHELCLPIPSNDGPVNGLSTNSFINAIGIAIPATIILISYCKIWLQSTKNRKAVQKMKRKSLSSARAQEDAKLGISMFLICFGFIFFSAGMIFYQLVLGTKNREASIVVLCLYWCQFYLNFIVYAILNHHYRKAFYFFLHNVLFCRAFCCQDENTRMRNLDNSGPIRTGLTTTTA